MELRVTRRGVFGRAGVTGGAFFAPAVLGALGACSGPGQAASVPAKKLGGSVEFWTNPGYAYKDHIGQKVVEEFQQANPGVTIAWSDAAIANISHGSNATSKHESTPVR